MDHRYDAPDSEDDGMHVELSTTGQAAIGEVDDLKSLKVIAARSEAAPHSAPSDAVGRIDSEHAWLRISWLLSAGERLAGPGWSPGFDRMIDYARSKGWVDDSEGLVRAHIEWREPA